MCQNAPIWDLVETVLIGYQTCFPKQLTPKAFPVCRSQPVSSVCRDCLGTAHGHLVSYRPTKGLPPVQEFSESPIRVPHGCLGLRA